MTVVNPKSISGINSITTGSGSDNLLTIHTSDANNTERVRVNSSGDVIVGSGVTLSPDGDVFATGVCTATSFVGNLTGNVTGNINGDLTGTLQTAAQPNITSLASGVALGKNTNADTTDGAFFSSTTNNIVLPSGNYLVFNRNASGAGTLIDFRSQNTSKGGIHFNGTNIAYQSGSNNILNQAGLTFDNGSNYLDDYEEGTWTPGMNNSITLSDAYGRYIKTGHTVHAWFRITFPSTSSSGHVIMQNLPFTNTSTEPATGGVARGYQTYDIENGPIYHIGNNNSVLEFYKNAGQNLAASNASTYQFRGCIIYQAA